MKQNAEKALQTFHLYVHLCIYSIPIMCVHIAEICNEEEDRKTIITIQASKADQFKTPVRLLMNVGPRLLSMVDQ